MDGQAGDDDRTGTPAPGRTVPEVVSQLEVARRYGVTSRAVGRRVQRVGRAGAALPLYPRVRRELTRLARNGDDVPTRQRCAQLLGVTPSPRGPGSAGPRATGAATLCRARWSCRPGSTRKVRAPTMMGDPLLWATSAALIIWVGFYLRVLRYRTVRPALRAALMAGYFEHCTPDGNVPAIVGPDGRVSLRARRLFRVARVRPALFLYAAGSSRGASFNHGRRRSQRGEWTVITIRGGDLAAAIGSRPIRYRPWDRAVVVIGAAGYRGPATITSGVVLADWKAGSSRTRAAISTTDPAPRRTE